MVRRFALALVVLFVAAAPVFAQAPQTAPPATATSAPVATIPAAPPAKAAAPAPTLTDVQKLTLQNVLLRIELAQRQAQQAQSDFDKARTEAQQLVSSLQVPGYDLDIAGLKYTPMKPAEPPAVPAPAPVKK